MNTAQFQLLAVPVVRACDAHVLATTYPLLVVRPGEHGTLLAVLGGTHPIGVFDALEKRGSVLWGALIPHPVEGIADDIIGATLAIQVDLDINTASFGWLGNLLPLNSTDTDARLSRLVELSRAANRFLSSTPPVTTDLTAAEDGRHLN